MVYLQWLPKVWKFLDSKRLKGFLYGFHVLGSLEVHLDDLKSSTRDMARHGSTIRVAWDTRNANFVVNICGVGNSDIWLIYG